VKYSVLVRNAKLDAIQREVGERPALVIFTGSPPPTCSSGATGTVLAQIPMPAEWMKIAKNGETEMNGTWTSERAVASGKPGYFRIYDAANVCHLQGSIGPDMQIVDDEDIREGAPVVVKRFTIRDNNG